MLTRNETNLVTYTRRIVQRAVYDEPQARKRHSVQSGVLRDFDDSVRRAEQDEFAAANIGRLCAAWEKAV